MPKEPACSTSLITSATRRIDLAGMQASLRQRPPVFPFSTTAVLRPSWAARMAATYPPGPDPMMMQSYSFSGMGGEPIDRYEKSPGAGIWILAIALTRNQKSVPEAVMISTSSIAAHRVVAVMSPSEATMSVSASSVCMPSTAQ